jgi:hypothetical protein
MFLAAWLWFEKGIKEAEVPKRVEGWRSRYKDAKEGSSVSEGSRYMTTPTRT